MKERDNETGWGSEGVQERPFAVWWEPAAVSLYARSVYEPCPAARAHQLPQVWILLVQDCAHHMEKSLCRFPPTSPNGTQKERKGKDGGRERKGEQNVSWPTPSKPSYAASWKTGSIPQPRGWCSIHIRIITLTLLCVLFVSRTCAWRNYDSSSWLPIKVASYSFVPVYILQKSDALQV